MNLSRNSWFLRSYLQCAPWQFPSTVCQLGRRIVAMTFVWLMASVFALLVVAPLLAVIAGLGVVLFTDKVFSDVFNETNPLISFAAAYLLMSGVVGASLAYSGVRSKLRSRHYSIREPGPVSQFTKGIWARIKDKTCVMINYKD